MKLFRTTSIANIDKFTIENEPVAAIDLMERASKTIVEHLLRETNIEGRVNVFCGPGNNGGDGLSIARLLSLEEDRFDLRVFLLSFGKDLSGAPAVNLSRLRKLGIAVKIIGVESDLKAIPDAEVYIDALFGSGLNRPLDGLAAQTVRFINQNSSNTIAVDIPSGLMGENNSKNVEEHIIKAHSTFTFQFPKISFLFAENEKYLGNWYVKDIGLHPDAIEKEMSNVSLIDDAVPAAMLKDRSKFAHKGNFGHALLIAGSYGKMGAAVLASKACLRSGTGLLTTHVPHSAFQIIQTAVPEAMTSIDDSDILFSGVENPDQYDAVGIGPGLGIKINTQRGLKKLIENIRKPMVLDADALNILGENREWLESLPEGSILTPHPKEFERLTKPVSNSYERMEEGKAFASKYKVVLIIKGAYTMVIHPDGELSFNDSGNPGMATGGSGDVLTGILLGLLAQGYEPYDAARIGVYVHGLAGDIALARRGMEALIAGDIIENLGEAFKLAHKKR